MFENADSKLKWVNIFRMLIALIFCLIPVSPSSESDYDSVDLNVSSSISLNLLLESVL
jgi:hypothetical protein